MTATRWGGDGCSATCNFDTVAQAKSGDIIITEVMADPVDASDEWVELLNIAPYPVDLNGLYFSDNTYYMPVNKVGGFVVQPGQYAVFSALKNPSGVASFPADFVYGYDPLSNIAFSNSSDEACFSTDKVCAKGVVAKITFTSGTKGHSHQLGADKLTLVGMKYGPNWCAAVTGFGTKGDFATPGKVNSLCK